jgi:P-type Cu2+ transporter
MTAVAPNLDQSALSSTPSDLSPTPTATVVLDVQGMKCAGCVRAVENQLLQTEGVLKATVNLVTEVAAVDYAVGQIAPDPWAEELAQKLTQSGFPAKARDSHQAHSTQAITDWVTRKEAEQTYHLNRFATALLLLFFSTLGHLHHLGEPFNQFALPVLSDLPFHACLATFTLIGPARSILLEGFQGLRRGVPNMNTLVSLGALSAYLASVVALVWPMLGWECFFDEPVMLLSFILLGRTLEERARFRSTQALRSLVALQPTLARLVPSPDLATDAANPLNGSSVDIPANQVQVNEWVKILPGEQIPVDGYIGHGQTTVDEAMLTGESQPKLKQIGDSVAAGTLNLSGVIVVRVTQCGANTVLAKMIELVETAQTRKAPIQRLADQISGVFTYGVLVLAGLTFCLWYGVLLPRWPELIPHVLGHLHHHHSMSHLSSTLLVSLKLAISVLVIACPCALGLATPTAILVGSGLGAERGLLIRGGDIFEAVSQLDTLVFDKTGTLTLGQPQVTDCLSWHTDYQADDLLQLAATLENGTNHPIARAILQATEAKHLPLLSGTDIHTEAGFGVLATVNLKGHDHSIHVGSQTWFNRLGIASDALSLPNQASFTQAGQTLIYISIDMQLAGLIAVADTLRPETAQTLSALQSQGLNLHILSGDRLAVVEHLASQLPLANLTLHAEISPTGKVQTLADLQAQGHRVGFVGDGINDAPALAQADVGIALASSTEIAIANADIILMRDTLTDVVEARKLSRATVGKIRQNLAWAFTYNLICIPLAAGALIPVWGISLNPGLAGGLMAFSSVSVVLNSLLLRVQLRER